MYGNCKDKKRFIYDKNSNIRTVFFDVFRRFMGGIAKKLQNSLDNVLDKVYNGP